MKHQVLPSEEYPGDWLVSAIADPPEGDGDIYLTIFAGPLSEKRAREYADWKNALEGDFSGHGFNARLHS